MLLEGSSANRGKPCAPRGTSCDTAAVLKPLLTVIALLPGVAVAHGSGHGTAPIDYSRVEETAFGRAADPKRAVRSVRIDMSDAMRFAPDAIDVKRGERVRFVVTNSGKVMHELVLGTFDELRKHGELMKKFPNMVHDEPHMVHVAPGGHGEIGWQFTRAGEFFYGCLIPGHFDAGMIGRIRVR